MINTNVNLLYRYIRGSHLYGLNVPTSDIDYSAVFMTEPINYLGTHIGYVDYMSDAKSDETWYELNKWVNGLLTSNPTMLESLFVPNDKIVFNNGILQPFFENKDMFLTKECYKPMFYYAKNQIEKAQGLNKKCVNPMTHREHMLDFCYVPFKQGSTKILNWLEHRGLKQKYCGCVNVPHMTNIYHIFYDWGHHFRDEKITFEKFMNEINDSEIGKIRLFILSTNIYGDNLHEWFYKQLNTELDYKGIASEDKDTQEVRLSSILKDEQPITIMSYEKNAYSQHCTKYREYKQWEKERNEARYNSNLGKRYDSKNLCHCFRIMTMCQEILEGKGMLLNRRDVGDAQFFLDIRNHKYDYDEIMEMANNKTKEVENIFKESTILETLDKEFINNILIDIQLNEIKKKTY